MKVSVIIPWRIPRQRDRREIADWCFKRYKILWPDAEFIFSDSGDEVFSRGKSINKGVEESVGEYCIVTDADYLLDFKMAKDIINDRPWTVAVKSDNYYFLEEGITNLILRNKSPDLSLNDMTLRVQKNPYFVYGGILAFPKSNFIKFDPYFTGYGWEDNVWYHMMLAVHGKEYRTDEHMFHMFHKRINESSYMKRSYDNKKYYDRVWQPIADSKQKIRLKIKELGLYDS